MYTRKSSSYQNEIFAWLTDKDLNGHFDKEVDGPGSEFFVSASGELYGVLGPEARWSDNLFNKLIQ